MHPRRNIFGVGRQQFLLAYLIVGAVLLAAGVGSVVWAQSNDDAPVVEVDPLVSVDEPGDPAPASSKSQPLKKTLPQNPSRTRRRCSTWPNAWDATPLEAVR